MGAVAVGMGSTTPRTPRDHHRRSLWIFAIVKLERCRLSFCLLSSSFHFERTLGRNIKVKGSLWGSDPPSMHLSGGCAADGFDGEAEVNSVAFWRGWSSESSGGAERTRDPGVNDAFPTPFKLRIFIFISRLITVFRPPPFLWLLALLARI